MNIVEELKDILEQSPYISSVNIDFSENKVGTFGLYSTGESLIKTSVTGKKTFINNFVLYFCSDSYDDINRINNSELIKNISNYLSEIWHKKIIDTVDNTEMIVGEIENISCSNGMFFEVPTSVNNGYTYQIQIKLRYTNF